MLALTEAGVDLRERSIERLDDPPPEALTALPAEDQRALRDLLRQRARFLARQPLLQRLRSSARRWPRRMVTCWVPRTLPSSVSHVSVQASVTPVDSTWS